MVTLQEKELQNIKGGGISFGVGLLIVAGVCFLIGAIDGYIRPLKCR